MAHILGLYGLKQSWPIHWSNILRHFIYILLFSFESIRNSLPSDPSTLSLPISNYLAFKLLVHTTSAMATSFVQNYIVYIHIGGHGRGIYDKQLVCIEVSRKWFCGLSVCVIILHIRITHTPRVPAKLKVEASWKASHRNALRGLIVMAPASVSRKPSQVKPNG